MAKDRGNPVRVEPPAPGTAAPVVFGSPHSGQRFPPDFAPRVARAELVGYEDRFVDELIGEAPRHGIVLLAAEFPRAYIDPNRALDDLDAHVVDAGWPGPRNPTAYADRGIGLIFRTLACGQAIYDRPLTPAELAARIDGCWQPFHAALDQALDAAVARWGSVWHIDWHSMRPTGDALAPDPGARRPDFVISDRDGRSAEPAFTAFLAERIAALGHSVALNDPFKGGYIVARHGRPEEGRHSVQVEINRALYLDPRSLERGSGFARLRRDLGHLAAAVAAFARARAG